MDKLIILSHTHTKSEVDLLDSKVWQHVHDKSPKLSINEALMPKSLTNFTE